MAVLTSIQRTVVWLGILQVLVADGVDISNPTIQADALAAVNATDDWADANQASYNAALPEPFATWATPRQKASLLAWVVQERFAVE
jgi:hypothetical protein